MYKILIISHIYPNIFEKSKGTFVFDQVSILSRSKEIKVISPILWIPFSKLFKSLGKFRVPSHKDSLGGIEAHYPKYCAIPLKIPFKTIMWFAGVLYFLPVFFEALKIKNDFKFNIIHSHFAFPDGFSAVILGKIFRKPVVLTVHGSDINLYTGRMNHLKPMVVYALNNATHIIAVSTDLKNKIIELGISDKKVSVIPNGYNPDLFKPMNKDEIREKLSLPLNKKIVLFIGHLIPLKGILYLIESMKIISQIRHDIMLVVVGEGYLRSQLEITVEKCGLSDYVLFVGSQPHEKIPLWINACDLLTLPSLSEGFGAVLIEAAACGKPIVASNVGGIPEASSTVGRKLVPPKDSYALANSILETLDSNFDSERIIKENKKFDFNNIVCQLTDIYSQILYSQIEH